MVADHQNPGDPSRQLQVSTDTQKARAAPVKVRVSLPSPRDCKATMLQGSGVVQVTDGSPKKGGLSCSTSPKKKASVQFFVEDEPAEVTAKRVDLKTTSEYWTQTTNMSTLDTRGELIRHKEARDSWTQLSSGARKQRDLVSQVLGGTPKSHPTSHSQPPRLSPRSSSPRNYALHETRLPLSPRQQKANEMATSESQLNGFAVSPTSKSLSPRNAAMKAMRDAGNDGLRRSNSQFSDLTGRVETSPRTPRRSELQDTAQVYWMNPSTEKSRLIAERQGRRDEETTGSLIHQSREDVENWSPRSVPETPRQKKVWEEERSCYDAASWKQASSEIARRRRDLRASKSMGALPDAGDALSPSERKRVHLASGQMREGIGDLREKHEDKAIAPGWVSPRSPRSTVIEAPLASNRALMNQPSMYQYRNLPANSPRARKVREQTTSMGFF